MLGNIPVVTFSDQPYDLENAYDQACDGHRRFASRDL